ncbi:MAG: glutamate mutase L [Candidatus Cloacimonadota bacterium]
MSKYIVVSDLGSTNTKTVVLEHLEEGFKLLGISKADTTVEAPQNDVSLGLLDSIRELESKLKLNLIEASSSALRSADDVEFYCTSSAGGGLQILVIGLTLFDSASSAKRAAYGAGGVLLDTFTIDDKRSSIEQMLEMKKLHPDMILITGGTDGGAVTGILRLTEILRIANPDPKYAGADLIPALYAGNADAAELIKGMIKDSFALSILPNLRPSLLEENLKPTRDMIQKVFLENVMEKAPGYQKVKKLALSRILPTPMAVLESLELISTLHQENILAFDIGGATTDVFSFIHGNPQRTVSANLGMSYSALNVLSDAGMDKLKLMIPDTIDEKELRNYLGNKSLYPTQSHSDSRALIIEHALAKVALAQALEQHQQMHFNTGKIGFLDKLKAGERDKYVDKFEYVSQEQTYTFSHSDIGILVGIGGIFTAVQNKLQAALILIDATKPKGITTLFRDAQFLSPHMGVLRASYPKPTEQLMASELMEPLAMHISPIYNPAKFKDKDLLSIVIDRQSQVLKAGSFLLIEAQDYDRKLEISLQAKVELPELEKHQYLKAGFALILDAREPDYPQTDEIIKRYELYRESLPPKREHFFEPSIEHGLFTREISLPFPGEIEVKESELVSPEMLVAQNPHNPPRLYILQPFSNYAKLSPSDIKASLLVRVGDKIDVDQVIMRATEIMVAQNARHQSYSSPINGRVEFIDPHSGIIVLSEIQDYSTKPTVIDVATLLGIKAARLSNYLTKHPGDYVNKGETIARRLDKLSTSLNTHVKAPTTGTIIDVDKLKGTLTIKYISKPVLYHSNVYGKVSSIQEPDQVLISFEADRLNAMLGLGRERSGLLKVINSEQEITDELRDKIVFMASCPSLNSLKLLRDAGIAGLICQWIEEADVSKFLGYELGIINTGNENLEFSLLILSGFGSSEPEPKLVSIIKRFEAQHCLLETQTRIRAGVVRPYCSFQQKKT